MTHPGSRAQKSRFLANFPAARTSDGVSGALSSPPQLPPHSALGGSVAMAIPSLECEPPGGRSSHSFGHLASSTDPGGVRAPTKHLLKEGQRTDKQAGQLPFPMWAFLGKKSFYFWKELL